MRLVTLSAATLLILPACTSEAASPVGTYTVMVDTTGMAAEMVQMMNAMTFSDLHIKDDNTWDQSMEMDLLGQKQTMTAKGTWVLEGDEIVMTQTHQDGEEMPAPKVQRGKYENGTFSLQDTSPSGETYTVKMTKKDS